jgi:PST family polysaccharide transporter
MEPSSTSSLLTTPEAPTSSAVAPTPATADRARLDRSLVRGLAYTGAVKWLGQVLAWASTLVVARLLTPADYGLVGMASVYIGLIALVNEFGLGTAIIVRQDLSDDQLTQLNTLAVVVGAAALAVSCAAAVPLSMFFATPALRWVVMAMSLGFLVSGFQTVPSALLQKEFQFKWLAFLEGAQAIVLGASMILFAVLGFGYWTLVLGHLLGATLTTAMVLARRRQAFAWPQPRRLRSALTFSRHVLIGRLAWYAQANADFLVAGRVLGQTALGVYSLAWTLASVPVDKVSTIASRVTPAFFSAVQTDRGALRRYLLVLTEAMALITIPLAWGLALLADDAVMLLLGAKWQPVTEPLRILAVLAALRSIVSLLSPILNATRRSRFGMYKALVDALLLAVAFWIGSAWGTRGIALAWLLVYPPLVLPVYWVAFRAIDMSMRAYLAVLWPAVTAAGAMIVAVLTVRPLLAIELPLPVRAVAELATGAGVYGLVVLALYRDRIHGMRPFLRMLRAES